MHPLLLHKVNVMQSASEPVQAKAARMAMHGLDCAEQQTASSSSVTQGERLAATLHACLVGWS
jgi:hypothetical protein